MTQYHPKSPKAKKALQEATHTSPTKAVYITKKGNNRRRTKPKAPCWQHFSKYSTEDGENRAKCNYYDVTYTMETGASTTNLNNHLKTCSRKPRGNTSDLKQVELAFTKSSQENVDLSTWVFNQDDIKNALINMIIVDDLPFKFVEWEGFKFFIFIACPRFHLLSRWTIRKCCLDLFNSMKNTLKQSLQKETSRICLTIDTWTSLQRISYMVLTAHRIDDEWKLQKRIINFCPIFGLGGLRRSLQLLLITHLLTILLLII
ncbi:hypothetical protein J1N35_029852 [Gossypium stocksii]|uniref:BED-type domain-containing protein n=1 Tax=Gossypium stocksii TaxID=47602 RepID=A0A9D3UZ28_9ROSI|nr:hypothetical protein J1N35_029852 [Gossypium stocksii]